MAINRIITALVCLLAIIPGACSSPDGKDSPGFLELEQSKSNSKLLAQFYLGGLYSESVNPLESGLLVESGRTLLIDIARLDSVDSAVSSRLEAASVENRLPWDDFERILSSTYYSSRGIPASIDKLVETYWTDDTVPFEMFVDGVMSVATRKIMIPVARLRSAAAAYHQNGSRVLYDTGTLILADHLIDGEVVEYTAMIKRADGFWDFAAYDQNGALVDSTLTEPKMLAVPTQCTGCHFGSRLFEPEKSFPGAAPDGPDGLRQILVEEPGPSASLVGALDEHRKRSDYILGLYATMYIHEQTKDGLDNDSLMSSLLHNLNLP